MNVKMLSLAGLVLYFAVLLFAVTKEKKNTSVLDYFFAGRTLPFWALSITFIASWWGAGSALSTADLAYENGFGAFWYYGVPVLLSSFFLILGSATIRKVGHLTQGRMMAERYDKRVARMLSVMILIFMTLNASSQMVGIGTFFGTYLGLDYEKAVLLGTLIVLVYSMFGGFRGVVLTDIIQFFLLLISAVLIFLYGMKNAGGLENIAGVASEKGKPEYMSFFAEAGRYAVYVFTFGLSWSIQANVWQRVSAARDTRDARRMSIMSFFLFIPLYLIVVLTGMSGIVLFDTLPEGGVATAIVNGYMPPVLAAFSFVGISAAIMSTMDSLINTGAMTLALDLRRNRGSEEDKLRFSRYATLMVSLAALLISLRIRSILDISFLASDVITTGVFVPLVLGFFFRRGNSLGALSSMIAGLVYSSYNALVFLGLELPHFYELQSAQQALLGMGISLAVYIGVSLLSGRKKA